MNTDAMQQDYGGFDTRFLGVIVRFDGRYPHTWELFKELSTADPSKVISVGKVALASSPERAFEVFSTASVLAHELRHFHDFILSSFGNTLFRMRMTTYLNGMYAISRSHLDRKTVPVPLSIWMSKSDSDRESLIARWNKQRDGLNLSPHIFSKDDEEAVEATVQTTSKIKDFLINPEMIKGATSFQPGHVFESSAINIQIQYIYNLFGAEHSENFIKFLLKTHKYDRYTSVFRLTSDLVGLPIRLKLMNAISTWCILGDYLSDGWRACPTTRFARLYELLRNNGLRRDKPIWDLLPHMGPTPRMVNPIRIYANR